MTVYKISFHSKAKSDLHNHFISLSNFLKDSKKAFDLCEEIRSKAKLLNEFPERNRAFGEKRIQLAGKYSIVYRIRGDVVEILRIVPSSSKYIAQLREIKE